MGSAGRDFVQIIAQRPSLGLCTDGGRRNKTSVDGPAGRAPSPLCAGSLDGVRSGAPALQPNYRSERASVFDGGSRLVQNNGERRTMIRRQSDCFRGLQLQSLLHCTAARDDGSMAPRGVLLTARQAIAAMNAPRHCAMTRFSRKRALSRGREGPSTRPAAARAGLDCPPGGSGREAPCRNRENCATASWRKFDEGVEGGEWVIENLFPVPSPSVGSCRRTAFDC